MTLGPIDPRFDKSVGLYLRSGPTKEQKECLREFFRELRNNGLPSLVQVRKIDDIYICIVCGHSIQIVISKTGGAKVLGINPSPDL